SPATAMPSPSIFGSRRISARAMCPQMTAAIEPRKGSSVQPRMPDTRLVIASALVGRATGAAGGEGGDAGGRYGSVVIAVSSEVELDALCQRQGIGVVDGVGLAAHVDLPRVGARLAAAAGFLLAAERAAD